MLINERGVREHIAAATAALNQPGGGKGAVMAEQGGLGNRLQQPVSRAQRSTKSAFTRVFDALWRSGVVRCRPGIVTNSESRAVPDQRCITSCCTASGK